MLYVPVNDSHGGVECLLEKMELQMDSNEPIHQDRSHLGHDLVLASEVVCVYALLPLDLPGYLITM